MIRTILWTLMALIPIIMSLCGCKGETGPLGPPGTLSGNLYGQVSLHDDDSSRIVDNSGVQVSVQGMDYAATSGTDGWWRIVGLSTGTYTLVFSKPGYGTYKHFGFQFVGGDSLFYGWANLGNIARYYVTTFAASIGSDSVVHLTGTVSSPGRFGVARYVVVFIDTIATVSSTRYSFTLSSNISSSTTFGLNESASDFALFYGVRSGSTLHCVAYGVGTAGAVVYYDPTLRNEIFATLSPTASQIVSVKLP
jgi:hypothetical protein